MDRRSPAVNRRGSLGTRIVVSFFVLALVISAAFTGVSFVFLFTVEDTFIERSLERQANLSLAQYRRDGDWGPTEEPYMTIYTELGTVPVDLRRQLAANPQQVEFSGDEERHYHVMRLDVDQPAWLVAEVSRILVIRPMQSDLLVLFAVISLLMTLFACVLALWLAWRSIAPLRRLAWAVEGTEPNALLTDFSNDYPPDEIGAVAEALQGAFDRIAGYVKREQAFTRDVSHDLRTPIAVVQSSVELLQRRDHRPESTRLIENIRVANTHMQRTVEALLALARETSAEGRVRPVLVAATVEEIVLQLTSSNPAKSLEVRLEIDSRATVDVREGVLEIVLANILGNSFQHAGHGHVAVVLEGTRLSIIDEGQFDEDIMARAFDEGVRRAGGDGLGRGLSIVQRVCDHHGISLEIEHRRAGTAVHLCFPVKRR